MAGANDLERWAAEQDPGELARKTLGEAERRGHRNRTVYAGAGGLLGAILGSFFGRAGAGVGGLLGALLGAIFGHRKDRDREVHVLPAAREEADELAFPLERTRVAVRR